jgi:transposase
MPKVISKEKREDIISNKIEGKESSVIAEFLRVTTRAVDKIWKQFRESGNVETKIHNCGRKSVISAEQEVNIAKEIKETPDVTLLELIEKFSLQITESGLSKWLKKRGYSFKKRQLIQRSKTVLMSKKSEKNG